MAYRYCFWPLWPLNWPVDPRSFSIKWSGAHLEQNGEIISWGPKSNLTGAYGYCFWPLWPLRLTRRPPIIWYKMIRGPCGTKWWDKIMGPKIDPYCQVSFGANKGERDVFFVDLFDTWLDTGGVISVRVDEIKKTRGTGLRRVVLVCRIPTSVIRFLRLCDGHN